MSHVLYGTPTSEFGFSETAILPSATFDLSAISREAWLDALLQLFILRCGSTSVSKKAPTFHMKHPGVEGVLESPGRIHAGESSKCLRMINNGFLQQNVLGVCIALSPKHLSCYLLCSHRNCYILRGSRCLTGGWFNDEQPWDGKKNDEFFVVLTLWCVNL